MDSNLHSGKIMIFFSNGCDNLIETISKTNSLEGTVRRV